MGENDNIPVGEVGRPVAAAASRASARVGREAEAGAVRGDWMVLAGLVVLAIIIGAVFAVILTVGADLG